MPRKVRTPLVLTDPDLRHAMSRLSAVLHHRAPPWAGGSPVEVDLVESLEPLYAAHRRRLVAAVVSGDRAASAMVAMFETVDTELRDGARTAVDDQRAYWERRRREVPAVDPSLIGGGR